MIIKSITLNNFRQFRGDHKIDFSTDDNRNVTVVMGENGSGKTTLEQAFIWCLYGVNNFQNKQLININVQNSMSINESNKVCVRLCIQYEGILHIVERTRYLTKKTMTSFYEPKDILKVKMQNKNGDWNALTELEGKAAVEKMLSKDLSGFFFFDGEHIENMSKELLQKKKSNDFKEAVRALVGLNALQAAMEHFGPDSLKRTVSGIFLNEIQDIQEGKLPDINDRIDKLQQIIMNCEERREKDELNLQDVENRINEIEVELLSMQDNINNATEYERYGKKILAEEQHREKDQDDALKAFDKDSYNILLMPLMKQALEELRETEKIDKGIPHMHADTIKFLLDSGHCICGNDLTHNQDCVNRMRELMESLPPNNLGTMIGNFVKDIRQRADDADGLGTKFIDNGRRYMQHDVNIEEYEAKQSILRSRLPNKERVASLINRKKENEKEKYRLRKSIQQCDEECGSAKNEKDKKCRERNTILSNDTRNRTNKLYYAYAKAVYDRLAKEYGIRVDKTRKELESVINEIFVNIYDSQIGIEINEDYSIKTYLQDNTIGADNLEKNTAQSYAVIFAFIAGIIKMYMEQQEHQGDGLPMVMDAPLSAFDKDRIKRICEALPKIAQQIIIFIKDTDGDIAEEHMSNVIGKKWLIQADSQTSSRIVERG